jgi:hypothetical protein
MEDLKLWLMIMSGITITGNLTVNGAAALNGTLNVSSTTTLRGELKISFDGSHIVERRTTGTGNLNLVLDTHNTGAAGTRLVGRHARNVSTELFPPQAADELIALDGRGAANSAYTATRALLLLRAAQTWTATAQGTELLVQLTPNNSTTPQTVMRLGGTKPTVTGSRGNNAALNSLLQALAALELIVNNTTA